MVHQHFMLIPGHDRRGEHRPGRRATEAHLLLDYREANEKVTEIARTFGLQIIRDADPGMSVGQSSASRS